MKLSTQEFKNKLKQTNLSKNTIESYAFTINQFFLMYKEITKQTHPYKI